MANFTTRACCPCCESLERTEIFACEYLKEPISAYIYSGYQETIPKKELEGINYVLVECTKCGLIYQRDILDDLGMKQLYEEWTGKKREGSIKALDISKEVEIIQEILPLFAYFDRSPETLSFFDFGMGSGRWLSIAQAFGCQSYGYDLSAARVKECQHAGFTILEDNQIEEHQFDFINTEQVFEHIPSPLHMLRRLKKSLHPHGLIKISVPNGRHIKKRLEIGNWQARKGSKKDLNPIAPLEHINCFDYHSLVKLGKSAGLKQVAIPLRFQYRYSMRWNSQKWFVKNLIKPLKRKFLTRGTYLFFTHD